MGIHTQSPDDCSRAPVFLTRRIRRPVRAAFKVSLLWLLLGPVSALTISLGSWFVFEYFSPGRLSSIPDMLAAFPFGLLLSLLTPWGWLMYGGFLLMTAGNSRAGTRCTGGGAFLLGCFWPVWATFLNQ